MVSSQCSFRKPPKCYTEGAVESSIADYFYPRNTSLVTILYLIATLYLAYLFYQKKGSIWFCLGFVIVMFLIYGFYIADQKEYGERYRPLDQEYPIKHITTCPDYMVFDKNSGSCKPISGSDLGESAVDFGRRFTFGEAKSMSDMIKNYNEMKNDFDGTIPSWHTMDIAMKRR